jgi:deferrochelatase/peroxidase EfeB
METAIVAQGTKGWWTRFAGQMKRPEEYSQLPQIQRHQGKAALYPVGYIP